jgi:hypothetical protein
MGALLKTVHAHSSWFALSGPRSAIFRQMSVSSKAGARVSGQPSNTRRCHSRASALQRRRPHRGAPVLGGTVSATGCAPTMLVAAVGDRSVRTP